MSVKLIKDILTKAGYETTSTVSSAGMLPGGIQIIPYTGSTIITTTSSNSINIQKQNTNN
jgi:hypothetical protein